MSKIGKAGIQASKALLQQIRRQHHTPDYAALNKMVKKVKLSGPDLQKLSHVIETRPMKWYATGDAEHPYQTKVDTHDLRIQLNDFPEQAFCTIQRNLSDQPQEPATFDLVQEIAEYNGFKSNWEMLDEPEPDNSNSPSV